MSERPQYPDLTPEELEFELRDHRAMAYNEYIRFQEERKQRKAAFDAAQRRRGILSRWVHAQIQTWHDVIDNEHEERLLSQADPLAGHELHKQHQKH